MNPIELAREHRRRFLALLEEHGAAAVVPTGSPKVRNSDSEFRFRPHSDFLWLTGFREPESVLVLNPRADAPVTLFLRPKDPEMEIWSGRRLGVEAACETLGVDDAEPLEELDGKLTDLLVGAQRLVYRHGSDPETDELVSKAAERCRGRRKRGQEAPLEQIDPTLWLHELRLFKDETELSWMRRAGSISSEAHRLCMQEAAPGRNECELDALLDYTFRRRGANGQAYTNIVAGGANACILHYIENDQPLKDGELVLIDAGCEWNHYASDVTRTFPVNGRFGPEQRALYDVVLGAQRAAIDVCRPGARFLDAHQVALEHLCRGLLDLGLLQGSLEEVLEKEAYQRFYMHKTGHWLGLDVHDCGAYYTDGESRRLEPGMVTTVEPGLYVAPDDETVDPAWRGIGIRIEDDVHVTAGEPEVLTADCPKDPEELEALVGGGAGREETRTQAAAPAATR